MANSAGVFVSYGIETIRAVGQAKIEWARKREAEKAAKWRTVPEALAEIDAGGTIGGSGPGGTGIGGGSGASAGGDVLLVDEGDGQGALVFDGGIRSAATTPGPGAAAAAAAAAAPGAALPTGAATLESPLAPTQPAAAPSPFGGSSVFGGSAGLDVFE